MYRDVWKLLKKDWQALLCSTLIVLSPLIGAAVVWDVVCLLMMATAVPFYSGRIDTPEPANPWLAAHLQDWMLAALAILSLLMLLVWFLLGSWMHMGIYGGLTDSLRGGRMRKADALMFRGRMRKAHGTRLLVRLLSVWPMVLCSAFWWTIGHRGDGYVIAMGIAPVVVVLIRMALVFVPPLQADFPILSGWELCDRSRELQRRFGPIRLALWLLPGVVGYFACSVLFWVCLENGSPISMCLGWTLTALLTVLPAMYTRAAVSTAYIEALRRENSPNNEHKGDAA